MSECASNPPTSSAGITLIELAGVLVVIGLIIGGILVGHELVTAARLRLTISQMEEYNAAVNGFRAKYGGLPGDLNRSAAMAFGLFALNGDSTGVDGANGDGDGLIESFAVCNSGLPGPRDSALASAEALVFWRQLSDARLIDGSFGISDEGAIDPDTGCTAGDVVNVGLTLPAARLGGGNFIAVYFVSKDTVTSLGDANYFEINRIAEIAGGRYRGAALTIAPRDAYYVDAKIDDGYPNSGGVVARGKPLSVLNRDPDASSAGCVTGLMSVDGYRSDSPTPACGVRIRMR